MTSAEGICYTTSQVVTTSFLAAYGMAALSTKTYVQNIEYYAYICLLYTSCCGALLSPPALRTTSKCFPKSLDFTRLSAQAMYPMLFRAVSQRLCSASMVCGKSPPGIHMRRKIRSRLSPDTAGCRLRNIDLEQPFLNDHFCMRCTSDNG